MPSQELGYRFPDTSVDSYLIRCALGGLAVDPVQIAEIENAKTQVFPVTATDLMPRFAGAQIGQMLRKLEADWIVSGFTLTKQQLLSTIA